MPHVIWPSLRRTARAPVVLAAAALAAAGTAVAGIASPAAGATPPGRSVIAHTKPPWATSSVDRGPLASGATVDARVYLAGRDPAGLGAFLRIVSDPRSPAYGRYLTPAQAQRRFGPDPTQTLAVTRWLRGAGFRVTETTPWFVAVHGSAATARAAFGATLHEYDWHGGHFAPDADVTVPAPLARAVLTVTGLDSAPNPVTSVRPHGLQTQASPAALPCSAYYGQKVAEGLPPVYGSHAPWQGCGYTPQQLRAAYGITGSGLTGKGVTVGIVIDGESPTLLSDVNRFAVGHGVQPLRKWQFKQVSYGNGSAGAGPDEEETLDVESVHTMAPDANVLLVHNDDRHADGPIDAMIKIVDGRQADIVSASWDWADGEAWPAEEVAFNHVFELGCAEGIGFYFSSGDSGDMNPFFFGEKAYGAPASAPFVTSVGGTSLAISKDNRYLWETGWGDSNTLLAANGTSWGPLPGSPGSGSGGGASTIFAQPAYQRGIVPDTLSRAGRPGRMRVFPDVALDGAESTPGLMGQTYADQSGTAYHEFPVSGTSLSCPLFAGIQALAQQAQGKPLGFANPALYARYRTAAYHDVTDHPLGPRGVAVIEGFFDGTTFSYWAVTLGTNGDLHATPGYDEVTGLGSVTRGYLDSFRRR